MPKNWWFWTVVLEKTVESPLDCKEIQLVRPKGNQSLNIQWKDRCWTWNSNTLATWCEELTHLKRPWYWERLRAGEGDDRGWDGWMASLTQWPWVWVNSRSWRWTGRPSMLRSVGSQSVGNDWVAELNWRLSWGTRYLCCIMQDLSLQHADGLAVVSGLSSVSWQAPQLSDFSSATGGLSSWSRGLSCSRGMCNLSSLTRGRAHIPCTAGGFLTTGPPGKSLLV